MVRNLQHSEVVVVLKRNWQVFTLHPLFILELYHAANDDVRTTIHNFRKVPAFHHKQIEYKNFFNLQSDKSYTWNLVN